MSKEDTAHQPPSPFERFRSAVKQVLSVSKEELEKRETKWRERRKKKRQTQ